MSYNRVRTLLTIMSNSMDDDNSQKRFDPPQRLAAGVLLAGLAYLFFIGDLKVWALFNLVAALILLVGYSLKRASFPVRMPSLTALPVAPESEMKFRLSPLAWIGFALLLVSMIFITRPRTFAVLTFVSLCVLIFNRYMEARS